MSITVSRSVYANGVNSLRVACYMASCCLDVWCCGVPASAGQVRLLIMILIMPADLFRRAFSVSRRVALNNSVLCNYQPKKGTQNG